MFTSRSGVLLLVSVSLVVTVLSVRAGSGFAVKAGSSAAAGQGAAKTGDTATRVFLGHIRTMDDRDTVAEAVAVDGRGVITAVGTESQVMAAAGAGAELVRLPPGQALLPGFIEPHMHVIGFLQQMSGLVGLVGACRPEPYKAGEQPCFKYIKSALQHLKPASGGASNVFIVGLELDPSRQPFDIDTSSREFKRCPAQYIEQYVSATRPVLIVDQSGHFGYVNHIAFDKLQAAQAAEAQKEGKPAPWPPSMPLPGGGEWNTDDPQHPCQTSYTGPNASNHYTGLLTEIPGYNPFALAVQDSVVEDFREDPTAVGEALVRHEGEGVVKVERYLRAVGITTLTNYAQTKGGLAAARLLAKLPGFGTRVLSVVPPAVAIKELASLPVPPACDPRTDGRCRLPKDLGADGIKTIADGSTQGCTAALSLSPALGPQYQATSECAPPEGRIDYTPGTFEQAIGALWRTHRWRFETHANGNRTIDMVLRVYSRLQASSPNPHTVTLIHATVGEAALWKAAGGLRRGISLDGGKITPIQLHLSHTIGHVPYWGAVFERQLGPAAAANIDPLRFDRDQGIPASFNSDAPVSLPNPLWFIRQAVTRETWKYPELIESHVLGPEHAATVREALQAVTINAAREKELDRWLGSIEAGKVADFVVLSQDPMAFDPVAGGDPKKISDIRVIGTYLGGRLTGRN